MEVINMNELIATILMDIDINVANLSPRLR